MDRNVNDIMRFASRSLECMDFIVKSCKEKGFTAEELYSAVESLNKLMEEKKND